MNKFVDNKNEIRNEFKNKGSVYSLTAVDVF